MAADSSIACAPLLAWNICSGLSLAEQRKAARAMEPPWMPGTSLMADMAVARQLWVANNRRAGSRLAAP